MMIARGSLGIARLASAAWVGAALLFVVTAVREVRDPSFDTLTKDQLALDRFPAYYLFGFVLVSVAFVGALTAKRSRPVRVATVLLALALGVMIGDFLRVYQPLVEMVNPPGRAKPAEFQEYHRRSMWLNTCNVGLCALASVLLCFDRTERSSLGTTSGQSMEPKGQEPA
jgi:hypothetical protein